MIFCSLTESISAGICLDNCITLNYDLSEVDYMSDWLQFSTVFGKLVECISNISCSSSTLHQKTSNFSDERRFRNDCIPY